jgi:hypothetical protein
VAAVVPTVAIRTHLAVDRSGGVPPDPLRKRLRLRWQVGRPQKARSAAPPSPPRPVRGVAHSAMPSIGSPRARIPLSRAGCPRLLLRRRPVAPFGRRLLLPRVASLPVGGRPGRWSLACLPSPRSCLGHSAVPIAAFASRSGGRGKTRRAPRIAQNPPRPADRAKPAAPRGSRKARRAPRIAQNPPRPADRAKPREHASCQTRRNRRRFNEPYGRAEA